MSQNTPCALLCAAGHGDKASDRPCALPGAPPEDESADPVGDGHSDAEWAQRHSPPSTDAQKNPEKKPA